MILSPSHFETLFPTYFYPKVNTTATTVGTIGDTKKCEILFSRKICFTCTFRHNWIWKSSFFIFHDFEPQPFWKTFFPTHFYPKVNTTATTVGTIGDLKNCIYFFCRKICFTPVPANWIWKSSFFISHDFEPQPLLETFFPTYFYPKVNTTATTVGTIGD